ncbi:MAG: 1-acyl-sn-glycerol-3-phosphate acyltransferase [Dysgonamonadaceae bacterium]|jgi:1-acyl-sn-glycerol-3-phosphate acyltransferase|nr:1-acyl-sn-glycerol-3-phosphate acyltransferase [Dysgonamonadaceae bacterium]
MERTDFEDIRPYNEDEALATIEQLIDDPLFRKAVSYIFPEKEWDQLVAHLRACRTRREFQHHLVKNTVCELVSQTADSLECSGLENIEKDRAYTYISNHRDIVLDASLLCILLIINGYDTTEIAIGDNLLLYPWIERLVRLNKSFIVKRNVSVRQMLETSNHLSQYIHYAVTGKNESVWIAQREGRAKDSNDRTQESLLKMLAMAGGQDFLSNLKELNITPVSFSYEYDPCDYLKAKEFQQKRDNPDFKKSQADDLLNMQTGISGYKGHIHIRFGQPIRPDLDALDIHRPKNELVVAVAALIDKGIFRNYRLYPGNYIAYDRLWGKNRCIEHYTAQDIHTFDAYLHRQLEKIVLENKDLPFLTEKILEMYAYPVKNQLEV